jgi:hypothetical protein
MSKQSFVTGQVLTAQQVNDLQTNDFNQTVSAKTASYTLVAADKGTRITMSSTSATTITVNTGLFEAGDTLFIQNLNTGVSTITAGTATVDTSASLALAQHEGGTLYFTSAGVSTFFKAAGAAASAGGTNWTLLNSGGTALTGAQTITVSGVPSGTDKIMVLLDLGSSASGSSQFLVRFNTDTGNNYYMYGCALAIYASYQTNYINRTNPAATNGIILAEFGATGNTVAATGALTITGCNASGVKAYQAVGGPQANENGGFYWTQGYYNSSSVISSVSLRSTLGNFDAGTVYVYTSA